MFKKRVDIYKKRDKESWKQMKTVLKEAGLSGVRAGHYQQDTIMACGCGAKMDPRNFGAKGKIDRDIYYIRVLEKDEQKARDILKNHGLVPIIDQELLLDASQRTRPARDVF